MSLKIVRSTERIKVEQIVLCIYGAPGLGKSTLGFSAEKPITLDFDRGAYRATNRDDSVQVETWSDVTSINSDDLKEYKTVVIDTAGRALDMLTTDIIKRNPKMGRGGALTLQGYGQLKSEFTSWLKSLRLNGKDVVLIAHSSEEKSGDDIMERLDVQGGSKGEIYKSADAMGRLTLVNGKRVLNFSPTDTSFGKNPGALSPLSVPDIEPGSLFLSSVIDTIKNKLNNLSEAQLKRKQEIADWLLKFEESNTVEHFNQMVEECKTANKDILPTIKGELHKRATVAGLVYEKENGYTVKK